MRLAEPRLQVHPAHDAVVIDRQDHVPQIADHPAQNRQRQTLVDRPTDAALDQHRQDRDRQVRDRVGQPAVALGAQVRLDVQHVDDRRPHTVASELLDDERLQLARPRPAPERVQALGVDDDEDDVVGRRARLEPDPAVVDQPIDLARRLEPVEHGAREHQRAQEPEQPQQGDPAPLRAARSALGEVLHVPTDAIPERAFNAVPSAPRAGSRADRSTSASSARRRAVGASCGGGSRACRRCAC